MGTVLEGGELIIARILIAGCGDVGTTLGLNLTRAGHTVWGLRRRASLIPVPLQAVSADLADTESLRIVPSALDYVVYAAAADGFSASQYRTAYVEGLRNLLHALREGKQQPQRILAISSTSVYAQHQGEWVDEMSPAEPESFAGKILREGEDLLWNSGFPATVVRFAGIYGPGRTRLLDSLRQGNARCVPGLYTNRVHREDGAAALQFLVTQRAVEPLYIAVDDSPSLQCEVLNWLAGHLGLPEPRSVSEVGEAEAALRANKRCSNARLRAAGFRFRYPSYQEGYGDLLKNYALGAKASDESS